MEPSFSLKGGASIGAVNASWPMATFEVSDQSLKLKVKLVGEYEFAREDVVSLEPHGVIPVIGKGVRIVHCKPEYSSKIIFWSTEKPEVLLERIREAGFSAGAPPARVEEMKRHEGKSIWRIAVLVALLLLLPQLFVLLTNLGK